ncbi:hypothetical protein J3F83DRAFT_432624 [Trichoderma novae-zelandiae]
MRVVTESSPSSPPAGQGVAESYPAVSLNRVSEPDTMAQALSTPHFTELCGRMASAQKYGELSDLVLVCNGQTISVHKLIVCLQCPVIKAGCTGPFAEASGVYEIQDCSFDAVQRMVDYLYTGDYQTNASGQAEDVHEMAVHATMFSLADVYLIDGLLALAETKFREAVKGEKQLGVFLQHVRQVYDLQCDSGQALRDVVVESVRDRVASSSVDADAQRSLESLIQEVPGFARDVARAYLRRRPKPAAVPTVTSWPKPYLTPMERGQFGFGRRIGVGFPLDRTDADIDIEEPARDSTEGAI